ncbi:MAG: CPBP family intramembrane metalloprotease [Ardenticatenaceae bacterium]|nr:CPBP family intramembrane metalloprotease [Ardenticatenaceae bacterium]
MMKIKSFIKRYALLAYFTLAFAISWGALLMVLGVDGFFGVTETAESQLPLVYMAVLTGPTAAGLLLTGLVYGKVGFRKLFARLFKWRVNVRWYAVALLTAPLAITATLFLLSFFAPELRPGIVTADNILSFLLAGIAGGLSAGIFEELGWTGFAVPELKRRYGIFRTGLLVGILWGAWHYPLFSGSGRFSGTVPPFLYIFVLLFTFLPAYRVLMVWVYDRTGSLTVAILMHMSLTASTLIFQPQANGALAMIYNLSLMIVLWSVVAIISLVNGRQLAQRPLGKQAA